MTSEDFSGLLEQIIESSREAGVPLAGENALQRYDRYAFDRIAESAFGQNARAGYLDQLTFLRMGDLMWASSPLSSPCARSCVSLQA